MDTLEGMRLLETWALEDTTRRYKVEWAGPVITIGASGWRGGWKVMTWTTRHPKRKLITYLGGRSLVRAAQRALERYMNRGHSRPPEERIPARG